MSGLMAHTGTILIEPNYVCKDHRNLFSNFYSKKFIVRSADCARLHFFSRGNLNVDDFQNEPEGFQNEYIGYSVLRPVAGRSLGRTVIDLR